MSQWSSAPYCKFKVLANYWKFFKPWKANSTFCHGEAIEQRLRPVSKIKQVLISNPAAIATQAGQYRASHFPALRSVYSLLN
jgi:hypothetical protein